MLESRLEAPTAEQPAPAESSDLEVGLTTAHREFRSAYWLQVPPKYDAPWEAHEEEGLQLLLLPLQGLKVRVSHSGTF